MIPNTQIVFVFPRSLSCTNNHPWSPFHLVKHSLFETNQLYTTWVPKLAWIWTWIDQWSHFYTRKICVDVDWITIPCFLRMKKISMDGPISIVKQSGDYFWVLPSGLGLPPQLLFGFRCSTLGKLGSVFHIPKSILVVFNQDIYR